jgi:hypothetical protein
MLRWSNFIPSVWHLYLVKGGQARFPVWFSSPHSTYSWWCSYQALMVASEWVKNRPSAIAIFKPHENHEWRSGLVGAVLFHQEKALWQKVKLHASRCAIEKLKRYKSPGIDQIPAEMTQAGGNTLRSEIHKLINCIWNKESIFVPIYKKGDRTDCSTYRRISLLSTSYKILSNILLSRLTPYVDEIIGDHQRRFRRNRSTTDQIFCICQILEKKWEYNGTAHQLFIDFKNV